MVKRRVSNSWARPYNPDFAQRAPDAYQGHPCANCRLPLLVVGTRDSAGRWVHCDCKKPPTASVVEHYLAVSFASAFGLDADEVLNQFGEELDRRAVRLLKAWRLIVDENRASQTTLEADVREALSPLGLESRGAPEPPSEIRRVAAALTRSLEHAPAGTFRGGVRTTRTAADAIRHALEGVHILGLLPEASEPGPFTMGISEQHRPEAQRRLRQLTGL